MTAAVFVAVTVAVAGLLCGHQGQPWPLRARKPREGRCAPACGPQSPFRLPRNLPDPPEASQAPPCPTWAHPEQDTA